MALQKSKSSGSGGGSRISRSSSGSASINKDGVITDENGNFAGGLFKDSNGNVVATDKDGNVIIQDKDGNTSSTKKTTTNKTTTKKSTTVGEALKSATNIYTALTNPIAGATNSVIDNLKKVFK